MSRRYKVIIIGSGFAGQLAALNLIKEGITDFLILERRTFMGGTWSQNVYPGAAVDVPSPLYSIASEPYDWTQMYAEQNELNEYTDFVIAKHRLTEKTVTSSNVTKIIWSDEFKLWQVQLEGQEPYQTQFIINCSGPLSTPVIPNFKGRDKFKGKSFHSNNWDADFDYKNKRVAIIGSGASAAQIIPVIADEVKHLSIFQRAAHWVLPRKGYKFKAWQRSLLRNKWLSKILRVCIYWQFEYRFVAFKYSQKLLDILGRQVAVKHIKHHINDPDLQRKVMPNFTFGCKRIILSNTLYPALCKKNVTLFDQSNGIKEITENGLICQDGTELELDLIVYSTGYDATDGVISYPVVGRKGQTLKDAWKEYPRAYLGTSVPNFPNLFIVTGPNTGIGHTSALFLIESQMFYIMNCIRNLKSQNKSVIEVKALAEEAYTNHIHQQMTKTVWHTGGCNSWYKSKSGKVIALFPGFSFTYRRWAKKFKANDHQYS